RRRPHPAVPRRPRPRPRPAAVRHRPHSARDGPAHSPAQPARHRRRPPRLRNGRPHARPRVYHLCTDCVAHQCAARPHAPAVHHAYHRASRPAVKQPQDRKSDENRTMNWQDAIPSVATAHAVPAVEPAMDSDQFAAFYQRSSRPLWAYLARASADPTLADDLTQESYVRFLSAGYSVDGEVAARMLLFRIASNLLRDHWRRHRAIPIEDLPEHSSAANPPAPDTSAQTEARLTLLPALAKLRPRDRQILWLAHAENYSHREIAEITGLAAPGIRLLLFRARRQMARLLKKETA